MEWTEPKLYHLAGTALDHEGTKKYLTDIGVPDWDTNAASDGEKLIEIGGKGCYKSFDVDLNPNLTRVRSNQNAEYIGKGIVAVGHGSVLEHVHETFAWVGVSRILTHELVRHRIANYSQESLRFVRLTHLKAYFPDVFKEPFLDSVQQHLAAKGIEFSATEDILRNKMQEVFEYLEDTQLELAQLLRLDDLDSFANKKKLTSAMRRMAPEGLATAVMMTTNLRQWRLIIEKRTAGAAEEEIRKATYQVFQDLEQRHPATFADAHEEKVDGLPQITFEYVC